MRKKMKDNRIRVKRDVFDAMDAYILECEVNTGIRHAKNTIATGIIREFLKARGHYPPKRIV